jgi:hypothetical protein
VAAARGARQRFSRFLFLWESAALRRDAPRAECPVMAARRFSVLLCGSARVVRLDAVAGRAGDVPRAVRRREAVVDGPADWGPDWTAAVARAAAGLRDPQRPTGTVDVVLPSVLVLSRAARCPRDAAVRRRGALAAYAAGAAMPVALAETAWMHAVTGGDAAALDLTVCAARAEAVEALLAGLETAGLRPRAVWPTPLAFHAALPSALVDAGVPRLALHLDGTSAVLWRLHRGRSWARSFRLPAAFAAAAAGERAAVVAREVRRTEVHFLRSGAEATPDSLVLAGDGATESAFAAALADGLGIPAAPLPPTEADGGARAPVEQGALVLAGRGAGDPGMEPPARRAAREARTAGRAWLLAGSLLAAALVVVAVPLHLRARERDVEVRRLQAATAVRRAAALDRAEREKRIAAVEAEAARLAEVLGQRATWLVFLADLEERCFRLGDIRLEHLEVEGGESPDAAEEVVRVRLGGLARAATAEDAMQRVRSLAAALVSSAAVASVGVPEVTRAGAGTRFDLRVGLRRVSPAGENDAEEDEEASSEGIQVSCSRAGGARSGALHGAGVETGVGDPGYRFGDGSDGGGTDGGEAK